MSVRRWLAFVAVCAVGFVAGRATRTQLSTAPPADYSQPIRLYRTDNHPHIVLRPHSVHIDGRRIAVAVPPPDAPVWYLDIDGGRVMIAGTNLGGDGPVTADRRSR